MLVVCAKIKGIIYDIEIPPYKAVKRECEIDNIVHDLVCSWFLIYIKDLDPINSQLQKILAMYKLILLDSPALLNIDKNPQSFLSLQITVVLGITGCEREIG